ncbi:hypothetical protein C8F04DRAFT_1188362 [Mycena alexandri]|uniref:Proteophosphoglycan ppg4 n=1 Tax=Mycena alexandri TaxID=1745969 RepID=A0AAD6SM15_9AGAR|nr:hypothetical protein C8F04DRAFT_1188362 [Mycena alexandri]
MLLPLSQPRALGNENPPSSLSPSTWIPIAVVVSVLTIVSILACTRKSIRARIASMGSGVAVANGMPVTRELTAEQLAGSINQAPGAPARRARRPRRTPSQISTVSLPAYMKEPGEQELVVSRGPDGEDVAMPAASAVDDEDDQSNESHQSSEGHDDNGPESDEHRHSNLPDNSRYAPEPQSPNNSPLLGLDPRGDAPAYFEVLDHNDEHYPPGISVAPPEPEEPATQRRSGFFSLFRPAPPPIPAPATSSTPNDPTRLSLTHTRTRSTTASPAPTRHRASTSTSTLFSLTRKKSTASLSANNLTSPSLISLASISHPLPHTLHKTEFSALPKSGLTAEQLSLISGSKEGGLGRFGVPWGEAAVAYASANTSRVALGEDGEAPPPGWEEVSGEPEASGSGSQEPGASGSGSAQELEGSGSGTQEEEAETPSSEPAATETTTHPARSDSRASGMSTQSFATAEEGVAPEDDDESEGPQLSIHVQEPTDATVRP